MPSRPIDAFPTLRAAAEELTAWLSDCALPLWASSGADPENGGFREGLTWAGAPHDPRRRTRVQARQAFVFATATAEGFGEPWLETARAGLSFLLRHGRRSEDSLLVSALDPLGGTTDPTPRIYEHAFVVLALSAMSRAAPDEATFPQSAAALREALACFRHPAGGFREAGPEPFQANAHMHLLEAALAWRAAGGDAGWQALADEVAALAIERFIDRERGLLHEFFDAEWRPRRGEAGLIEPGHQFEWAWLLDRWGDPRGAAPARRLFEVGLRGVDPDRSVVVNALAEDLTVRDAGARLWPQTERLKAAVLLRRREEALAAANSLAPWLDTPTRGVWRERMQPDGSFVEEPSPATSLYHLAGAILELRRWVCGAGDEPC